MNLDDLIQLIVVVIAMSGGLIAQILQGKKRAARRARRQAHRHPAPKVPSSPDVPDVPPGEDEIARRVREMLERAAGRKPAPELREPPRAEPPPPAPAEAEPRPSYSRDTTVRKGFQQEGKAMGGDFRVFPPSGISEGPVRRGKERKKKAPAAVKAKIPEDLPAAAAVRLDAAHLALLLRCRPELGILGYEILGPPPALREKPPSWEWW